MVNFFFVNCRVRVAVWMAGGGVRGGTFHGQTDEIGHKAAVDKVSVNDLHATILHLLGMDHKRLTFRTTAAIIA